MISKRNYLVIFILLLVVFGMFMFAGISADRLWSKAVSQRSQDKSGIPYKDMITAENLNMASDRYTEEAFSGTSKRKAGIFSGGEQDSASKLLVEWCVYNKYPYRLYSGLVPEQEIEDLDLLLFGDYEILDSDSKLLKTYAHSGKTMIFTHLPDYEMLSADSDLASFFGIKEGLEKEIHADGIKIFSDFMINKERVYSQGDYFGEENDTQITIPYYALRAGYEIYAVGILENQKSLGIEDKDLPPLLWKTTTENASVFSVNSEVFDKMALLGILTGFMSQEKEIHIYPIVNAQTMSVLNYPYFAGENKEVMHQMYSRTPEAVGRDLLWSNIVQILKNYGTSFNFFSAPQLDYEDRVEAQDNYLEFYLREISKLPGDMGFSLSQVSESSLSDIFEKNQDFFERTMSEYYFTTLYADDFEVEEIKENIRQEFLKEIRLILSDYQEDKPLIRLEEGGILAVMFNKDGYRHETLDDLAMIGVENALGMCNVQVDIGRVFYPDSGEDEWNNLSLKWSRGDTYFEDFDNFDMVSIQEMEKRVRRFLALDFDYEDTGKEIQLFIDNFEEEAYFIISAHHYQVKSAENAKVERISNTAFLIRATDADVTLHLKEQDVLEKPSNNKIIPETPEKSGNIKKNP